MLLVVLITMTQQSSPQQTSDMHGFALNSALPSLSVRTAKKLTSPLNKK